MTMLCPDCGVEIARLVEGSCPRCFVKRHAIAEVPRYVDVLLCASCGARRQGETWEDQGSRTRQEVLDRAVVDAVRFHPLVTATHIEVASEPQDDRNHSYDVMVDGQVEGLPVDSLFATTLRIKQGVCTQCSRQAGGYFSAILQIRGSDREPTDEERQEAGGLIIRSIDRMKAQGNQNAFLTKQGKVKGGHDFYISEIDVGRIIAKKVAERFDTSVQESFTLVGEKEGRPVHRITFLVRLPPYRTGDFLDWGKGIHRIERVDPKTLVTRELRSGRQVTIPRDRIERNHVAARKDEVKDAIVCSVVRDEALILDPVTNKTHEIRLPPGFEYDLSIRNFQVIEHDDEVYFVDVPRPKNGLPLL